MSLTSAVLTTTFTPAPSCTTDFYTNTVSNWYSIGGPLASQCFPSGWQSTSQYFSPGICPQGYMEACQGLTSSGSMTETYATCCPSGYICYTPTVFNFVGQACASIFTSQITTTVTDGSELTPLIATLHVSTEAVNGYGVSIRYNQADRASITGSMSSSSSSSSSTATATQNSASTSYSSSTRSSSSSSPSSLAASSSSTLSTGAKAGIGAGVGVVALIAIIGLAIFFIRQKRNGAAGTKYMNASQELDGSLNASPPMTAKWAGRPSKDVHEFYTPPAELQ